MNHLNVTLLAYTDLVSEIDRMNTEIVETHLADKPSNPESINYRSRLLVERVARANTGEWQDHRDNA